MLVDAGAGDACGVGIVSAEWLEGTDAETMVAMVALVEIGAGGVGN